MECLRGVLSQEGWSGEMFRPSSLCLVLTPSSTQTSGSCLCVISGSLSREAEMAWFWKYTERNITAEERKATASNKDLERLCKVIRMKNPKSCQQLRMTLHRPISRVLGLSKHLTKGCMRAHY